MDNHKRDVAVVEQWCGWTTLLLSPSPYDNTILLVAMEIVVSIAITTVLILLLLPPLRNADDDICRRWRVIKLWSTGVIVQIINIAVILSVFIGATTSGTAAAIHIESGSICIVALCLGYYPLSYPSIQPSIWDERLWASLIWILSQITTAAVWTLLILVCAAVS